MNESPWLVIRFFCKEKCHGYTGEEKELKGVKHTHFEHTYVLASLNVQTARQMFFPPKFSDLPSLSLEHLYTEVTVI